eukprot:TRINITY_DN61_c0_g1_i19.p1 TRINITY_DN61_c0_g1~~TRINITY_DN61_c0_g1_i19.p1  ORF type:complete len:284 (-),score=18.21 TRINITY_DN61_c0_g1_i19:112-864(-)
MFVLCALFMLFSGCLGESYMKITRYSDSGCTTMVTSGIVSSGRCYTAYTTSNKITCPTSGNVVTIEDWGLNGDCSGAADGPPTTVNTETCTSNQNPDQPYYFKITCPYTPPAIVPTNQIVLYGFPMTDKSCSTPTTPEKTTTFTSGQCMALGASSEMHTCDGYIYRITTWLTSNQCSGTGSVVETGWNECNYAAKMNPPYYFKLICNYDASPVTPGTSDNTPMTTPVMSPVANPVAVLLLLQPLLRIILR